MLSRISRLIKRKRELQQWGSRKIIFAVIVSVLLILNIPRNLIRGKEVVLFGVAKGGACLLGLPGLEHAVFTVGGKVFLGRAVFRGLYFHSTQGNTADH